MTRRTRGCSPAWVSLGVLLAWASPLSAADWYVSPEQSIQAAVDGAANGDTLRLADGTYLQAVLLEKGLTIQAATSTNVTVAGAWTIRNVNAAPVRLHGFAISGMVTATNVASLTLSSMRVTVASGKAVNSWAANLTVHKSTIVGELRANSGNSRVIASRVVGSLYHDSAAHACTVFQSTLTAASSVTAATFWMGYSQGLAITVATPDGLLVGCRFDGLDTAVNLLAISSGSVRVRNCVLRNAGTSSFIMDSATGVRLSGTAKAEIRNCVFSRLRATYPYSTRCGIGVAVASSAQAAITGCVFNDCYGNYDYGSGTSILASGASAAAFCTFYACSSAPTGGIVPTNCQTVDPKFVDTTTYALQAASPCRNAGDPASPYNDWDGSRNDIGCWGGHQYDTNGWTTTLPVVLATDAVPASVPRGTSIQITAPAAVTGD